MSKPEYQLVLQFPCESSDDFDAVIDLENRLIIELRDLDASVDGHDLGSGEVNIFIVTSEPVGAFARAHAIIQTIPSLAPRLRAAFRNIHAEEYAILWPVQLTEFAVT